MKPGGTDSRMENTPLVRPPESERIKSGRVLLAPGEAVGAHTTHDREEVLVVLSGTATLIIYGICGKNDEGGEDPAGEARAVVPAGSLQFIPRDTRHDVRNETAEPLEYVYVVSLLDAKETKENYKD
jgi:mannose-6-phosphate isomerase-like protein (cupin superfamily)